MRSLWNGARRRSFSLGAIETVRREVAAWKARRNNLKAKVNWQFTTKDARVKLKRLYPTTTS